MLGFLLPFEHQTFQTYPRSTEKIHIQTNPGVGNSLDDMVKHRTRHKKINFGSFCYMVVQSK